MTHTVIDQMQRKVTLPIHPKRIVSLVPSQTELLADLGLEVEVVGITKFCVRPERWFRSKARIGGTKMINQRAIEALKPDLILANKEENTKEDIAWLEERYPVWISDIKTIPDALEMIVCIGALVGRKHQAQELAERIRSSFEGLAQPKTPKRALYLIWKNPYMAAGPATFIHHMLHAAGFENVLSNPDARYPELSVVEIESLKPDVVFLSSEPFPFKGRHASAARAELKGMDVMEVDGELFSWYGSRMLKALDYFERMQSLR
jgi:ABC-type Fe3+-hydroxamate transport system substrate-binding protein